MVTLVILAKSHNSPADWAYGQKIPNISRMP